MPGYFDLNNRVALITGASRGLGLAMAEALAEVGATSSSMAETQTR
jgi:NAD(P)-dependent dehydrogenase (short-subunit alcohol dehydrogenase family)